MLNIKNKALSELIARKKTKVLEFPTNKDFKITCVYFAPAEFQKLQLEASLDEDIDLQKSLLRKMVTDWKGLTLDYLLDITVLDNAYTKEDFTEEELASEIEFNEEHLDLLYECSDMFNAWVNKVVTNAATFRS